VSDLIVGADGEATRTRLDDGLLTVWLNRPEAAHARNQTMRDELASLWRSVASDRRVHVVVLTGTGSRYFSAGMDLKEAASEVSPDDRRDRIRATRDIELLAALPQPTIAAVNGYALGGGLEMALACDLRLIAVGAKVGLPEVTIGLVPGGGGTQRLPRLVGYQRAAEIVLTGRQLSADEAVACGMILRTVEPGDLLTQAEILARELAAKPGDALRCAKELLRRSQEVHVGLGTELEVDALLALLSKTARPSSQIHTRVEDALIATA
jgi:enoyl-CoA hydratase/carnithine racemase